MAYDDRAEGMNHGDPLPDNPHQVVEQIANIDANLEELRNSRRQLVDRYHLLMTQYEKHYNEVCNRPEPAERPIDMGPGGGFR